MTALSMPLVSSGILFCNQKASSAQSGSGSSRIWVSKSGQVRLWLIWNTQIHYDPRLLTLSVSERWDRGFSLHLLHLYNTREFNEVRKFEIWFINSSLNLQLQRSELFPLWPFSLHCEVLSSHNQCRCMRYGLFAHLTQPLPVVFL